LTGDPPGKTATLPGQKKRRSSTLVHRDRKRRKSTGR
jgi:hypothetical protein